MTDETQFPLDWSHAALIGVLMLVALGHVLVTGELWFVGAVAFAVVFFGVLRKRAAESATATLTAQASVARQHD